MNRTLPPGDCGHRSRNTRWQSGPARTLPRAFGLVWGVAAAASPARLSHGCATFGPRSLRWRRVDVSANTGVTWQDAQELGPEAGKPAAAVPGGPGRGQVSDATG